LAISSRVGPELEPAIPEHVTTRINPRPPTFPIPSKPFPVFSFLRLPFLPSFGYFLPPSMSQFKSTTLYPVPLLTAPSTVTAKAHCQHHAPWQPILTVFFSPQVYFPPLFWVRFLAKHLFRKFSGLTPVLAFPHRTSVPPFCTYTPPPQSTLLFFFYTCVGLHSPPRTARGHCTKVFHPLFVLFLRHCFFFQLLWFSGPSGQPIVFAPFPVRGTCGFWFSPRAKERQLSAGDFVSCTLLPFLKPCQFFGRLFGPLSDSVVFSLSL